MLNRKDLACLLMLVDHIGAVLLPDLELLRAVGRLAFPLFAYQVAVGIRHTSDSGRYFLRLLLFALVAQPAFMLLFQTARLNILFSFALVVLLFHLHDRSRVLFTLILCSIPLLDQAYGLEYGLYGVLTVYIFANRDRRESSLLFAALTLFFVALGLFEPVQLFSILALPLLLIDFKGLDLRLNNYLYYLFYPVHLTVLRGAAYVLAG